MGGGGSGPPGGAGRTGREKTGLLALRGPEAVGVEVLEGGRGVALAAMLEMELGTTTRDPSPECTAGPPARPRLPKADVGPLLRVGDRFDTLPYWSRGDTICPTIGISPEVGVCRVRSSAWLRKVGESLERKSS
jgi:hypothetical protein